MVGAAIERVTLDSCAAGSSTPGGHVPDGDLPDFHDGGSHNVVSTVAASTMMVCAAAPLAPGRAHLPRPLVLGPADPLPCRSPLPCRPPCTSRPLVLRTGRSSALVDPLPCQPPASADRWSSPGSGFFRQWSLLAWQWASLPLYLLHPDSGLPYPGRSSFLSGHRAPAKRAPFPITASRYAMTETATSRHLR